MHYPHKHPQSSALLSTSEGVAVKHVMGYVPLLGPPLCMFHMVGYNPLVILALYISFIIFSVWISSEIRVRERSIERPYFGKVFGSAG